MAMENDGLKCPVCFQGTLQNGVRKKTYRYRGQEVMYDQQGAYCNQCDEGLITGTEVMPVAERLRLFRKQVDAELEGGQDGN